MGKGDMAMLWSVTLFHFMVDFFGAFFKPLGPLFTSMLGISTRDFATLLTTIGGIAALTQIVWGIIADRCKREGILVLAIVIVEIIAASFIGIINSFILLAILILTVRVANSAFHPVGASIAGHEKKSTKIAIFSIMGGFGAAIAPATITWYVRHFGIERIWIIGIVGVILALLISIPLWSFRKESVSTVLIPHISLWKILTGVFIVVSLRSFIMEIFHTYLPFYVELKGGSILMGGITLTLGMLLGTFTNYLGARYRDKMGIQFVNVIAFSGMALFGLIFYLSSSSVIRTIAFMLFDASAFFSMSANLVEAQFLLPNNKGFASSIAMGFSWAIGQFLAGAYASVFGNNVSFMLLSMIIFSFIMIPTSLSLKPKTA